jgi:hypothetical protein
VRETKPFYLTSEFYLTLAVILGTLFGGEFFPVPDRLEGIIAGVIAAAYAVSRGLAKLGVPDDDPVDDEAAALALQEYEADNERAQAEGAPPPSEARPRRKHPG